MKSYKIQHDFLYVGLSTNRAKACEWTLPTKKIYAKSTPVRLSLFLSRNAEELMKVYSQHGLSIMLLDDIPTEENEVFLAYKELLISGILNWFSRHRIYAFVRSQDRRS